MAADFDIRPMTVDDKSQIVALCLRAWAPVFDKLKPAVLPYVYEDFYPEGWQARQTKDIEALLDGESEKVFVAVRDEIVLGFAGLRFHFEDQMGEIHIIAVDPDHQREGIATAFIELAMAEFKKADCKIVMVETGGDPGHDASRATYENAGFERWPVARYFREV